MSTTHVNIEFLGPLLTMTKFLAISPNYDFAKRKLRLTRWHRIYSFLFASTFTMFMIYSSYGRYKNIFKYMSKTRIFLEMTSMSVLFFINFFSTGSTIFYKSLQFEAILIKFAISDDIIRKHKAKKGRKFNAIYFEIACLLTFTFLSLFFSSYLWITTAGIKFFKFYICENLQKMRLLFVMWLSYKIVLAVKCRFFMLNHVLAETLNDYVRRGIHEAHRSILGSDFKSDNHSNKWIQDVRTMARLYTLLYEIIDSFNDVFGWILFFVLLNNICGCLVSAHHVITFQTKHLPTTVAIGFVAFSLTYAAPFLTLGAVLASHCNACVQESRETSTLAYKLLHELKDVPSRQCRRLCEDLHLLAQQATTRYPVFSAAGFCRIDYTMLFTMIGIFASYLVVVLQFIKIYESIPAPIGRE